MVDSNNDPTFVDIAIPANTSNSRRFVFEVFWSFPPNLYWCSVESVLKTLEGTPGWETGNALNGHSPKQENSADLSTCLSFIGNPSIHCYAGGRSIELVLRKLSEAIKKGKVRQETEPLKIPYLQYGCFLKWWVYPTTMGFPTKMIILGCFGGTII